MLTIKKEGVLLSKTQLSFEDSGVLNPAIVQENGIVHLFYRAVRNGNHSTIGYCRLEGPLKIVTRNDMPVLSPEQDYESQGMEDPRLVKIDNIYYLSYCAYDGVNAMGALLTSPDLIHFTRHGIIVPQLSYEEMRLLIGSEGINEKYKRYNVHLESWTSHGEKRLVWDKNVVFFPRKIHGKIWFLHRIKPDIQIASVYTVEELTTQYWAEYLGDIGRNIALSPKYDHEVSYIGAGCPPIETEDGWLIIYHSVRDTINGYVYSASAALMNLEDPGKEISRLPYPLFVPDRDWELTGEVNNVVFPTGTARFGDTLYIYYGAADEQICSASLSIQELLKELALHTNRKHNGYEIAGKIHKSE